MDSPSSSVGLSGIDRKSVDVLTESMRKLLNSKILPLKCGPSFVVAQCPAAHIALLPKGKCLHGRAVRVFHIRIQPRASVARPLEQHAQRRKPPASFPPYPGRRTAAPASSSHWSAGLADVPLLCAPARQAREDHRSTIDQKSESYPSKPLMPPRNLTAFLNLGSSSSANDWSR
jgi:hypothetical protein